MFDLVASMLTGGASRAIQATAVICLADFIFICKELNHLEVLEAIKTKMLLVFMKFNKEYHEIF